MWKSYRFRLLYDKIIHLLFLIFFYANFVGEDYFWILSEKQELYFYVAESLLHQDFTMKAEKKDETFLQLKPKPSHLDHYCSPAMIQDEPHF